MRCRESDASTTIYLDSEAKQNYIIQTSTFLFSLAFLLFLVVFVVILSCMLWSTYACVAVNMSIEPRGDLTRMAGAVTFEVTLNQAFGLHPVILWHILFHKESTVKAQEK